MSMGDFEPNLRVVSRRVRIATRNEGTFAPIPFRYGGKYLPMRSPDRPILIVDDNRLIRDALADVLEPRGYETVAANSGEAALRYFREGGQACLVILDIAMPGMSGIDLPEKVRDNYPETIVILVTAFATGSVLT